MAHGLVGVVTGGTEGDRRGARLGDAARGFGIVGSDAEMAGATSQQSAVREQQQAVGMKLGWLYGHRVVEGDGARWGAQRSLSCRAKKKFFLQKS